MGKLNPFLFAGLIIVGVGCFGLMIVGTIQNDRYISKKIDTPAIIGGTRKNKRNIRIKKIKQSQNKK